MWAANRSEGASRVAADSRSATISRSAAGGSKKTRSFACSSMNGRRGVNFSTRRTSPGWMVGVMEAEGILESVKNWESVKPNTSHDSARATANAAVNAL